MSIRAFQPPLISRFQRALAVCALLFGSVSAHAAGDWFIYADRAKEMAALSGPPDVIRFVRENYAFILYPGEHFKIVE